MSGNPTRSSTCQKHNQALQRMILRYVPHPVSGLVVYDEVLRESEEIMTTIAVASPKSTILQNPISPREPSWSLFGGSLKGLCLQLKPRNNNREDAINLVVASTNSTTTASTSRSRGGGRFYINFTGFPFPLGPFLKEAPLGLRSAHFLLYLLLDSVTLVITVMLVGLNFYSNEYICSCFQLRIA